MELSTDCQFQTKVATRIAGEDIRKGDFVAILSEIVEIPSWFWNCSDMSLPAEDPVRMRCTPRSSGRPFKVAEVCLPFVYVKTTRNKLTTLDTRHKQLVRLDAEVGELIWRRLSKRNRRKKK